MMPDDGFPADLDAATGLLLNQVGATAGNLAPVVDIDALRSASRVAFLSMEGDEKTGAVLNSFDIPNRQFPVPVRLYEPKHQGETPTPLVIFLHGGGWSVGDLDCYDGLCSDLCAQASVKILSVGYRLSPETPFPGALADSLCAIHWAFENAGALNVDSRCIALMGDSAGGNLATVAAADLALEGKITLSAQFLIYPMLDIGKSHDNYRSRGQFGDGDFMLSRQNIDDAINWYVTNDLDLSDPQLSPTNFANNDLLPPTYMVSARYDPLFDEGQVYARKLKAAGKLANYRVYPSIHAFLSFGVLPITQRARKDLARDISVALGGSREPAI